MVPILKMGGWTPGGLRRLRSWLAGDGKCLKRFGGPGEIRTHDLFHAMEARSQLRHRPSSKCRTSRELPERFSTFRCGRAPNCATGPLFLQYTVSAAMNLRFMLQAVVRLAPLL